MWSRAYWLSRSKIWIDNYRKPLGTVKRKNQYYLNTNHYNMGIKATGLLRGERFSAMAYLVSKNDSDMIDELVIDSKWCEECFDKALVYEGHMLKAGSPRCDILYGNIRYANKNACRHCPNRNKCYKGKNEWKEIDFTKDCLEKPCRDWLKVEGKTPDKNRSSKGKYHFENL